MRRCLMLRMVSGMLGRLGLGQASHCEYTEYERNGKELAERVIHALRHFPNGAKLIYS